MTAAWTRSWLRADHSPHQTVARTRLWPGPDHGLDQTVAWTRPRPGPDHGPDQTTAHTGPWPEPDHSPHQNTANTRPWPGPDHSPHQTTARTRYLNHHVNRVYNISLLACTFSSVMLSMVGVNDSCTLASSGFRRLKFTWLLLPSNASLVRAHRGR